MAACRSFERPCIHAFRAMNCVQRLRRDVVLAPADANASPFVVNILGYTLRKSGRSAIQACGSATCSASESSNLPPT